MKWKHLGLVFPCLHPTGERKADLLWISHEWESINLSSFQQTSPFISLDRIGSPITGHCQDNGTIFIPISSLEKKSVFQMHLNTMDMVGSPGVYCLGHTCPACPFTEANTTASFLCTLLNIFYTCSFFFLLFLFLFREIVAYYTHCLTFCFFV